MTSKTSRRKFLGQTAMGSLATLITPRAIANVGASPVGKKEMAINGHLWVYASNFPPNWDCTPILENVFSDFAFAGIEGVELMEGQLRHNDAVPRIKDYIKKYGVGVSGSSYGVGFSMWDRDQHRAIMDDITVVIPRLAALGGSTFGISVGEKKEDLKTEGELDAQAELLSEISKICADNGITPNLHNHTYEVANDMHDLKGTLERLPDFKLGPDINWLIRAGVDPVTFINTYGKQLVYLHIRDEYANVPGVSM